MKSSIIIIKILLESMAIVLLLLLLLVCVQLSTSIDPENPEITTPTSEVREHYVQHQHTHHCIHDEIESWKKELGIKEAVLHTHPHLVEVPADPHKRHVEEVNQGSYPPFQPLRIYIASDFLTSDIYACYQEGQVVNAMQGRSIVSFTCTQNDVLTQTKKDYLVNVLLKKSLSWLESALNVVRTPGNLLLNTASCTSTSLDVSVPSFYQTTGVDADFVLFVTARPILGGSTLAFASTCATDNTGRPVAGQANFNTSNLVGIPNDLPRQAGVATHEISHALGFSSTRWEYGTFIQYTGTQDSSGNYLYTKLSPTNLYVTSNTGLGHNTIITPTLVQTVRNLFSCSSLIGGDLEDGGSTGTAGSHWEKRVFMNEYMTGSEVNYPILSNITLSLFQDTGWYTVNFNVTEPLLWGRGLGCSFSGTQCENWPSLAGKKPGFCSSQSNDVSCNYDRRGYGICNIVDTLSNIPSYYQHYGSSSVGGQSMLADYCGYVGQEGITTWCNIGSTSIQQASDYTNLLGTSDYGEQFTIGSRCMLSTLSKINTPVEIESFTDIIIPSILSSRCYNTTCAGPNDMRVQVEQVWYSCDDQSISVIGFGGALTCPPAAELCSTYPKDTSWPLLTAISPTSGGPSTVVTLTGGNFNTSLYNYTVIMEVECTNVKVVNNQTIIATIPGSDHFVSLADLALFKTRKHVVVRDSRGYTAQMMKAFTIQVEFDSVYLQNLFNWMSNNPLWALLIWVIILTPFICCCCCIYRCCCKKPKKPQRAAHHEYTHERDYYDDDYEVDDHYDVKQGHHH